MKKALEEFQKFTDSYKEYGNMIELKINHTKRVTDISEAIAKSLKLSKEEEKVAILCGLLHDIGRFEQWKRFQTYVDSKSLDHGDLGYRILKKDNYISKYCLDEEYQKMILKAVKYHNKYALPKRVSKKEKLFCDIVRDADKLDILYLFTNDTFKVDSDNQTMNDDVMQCLREKKSVRHPLTHTKADLLGVTLGLAFDLNCLYSFQFLKESKYMDIIIDKMIKKGSKELQKQLEEIRILIHNHIEEMIPC